MAVDKRCGATRAHKPHLWSRTTRKTVTEETAGDTFQCPGSASVGLRSEKDDRGAQIAADARSGRNWASEAPVTPACTCGAGERLLLAARAFRGLHGRPDGRCSRHPGGTVARKPGGTRYPGENGN
jgi:hypothetical protein